MLGTLRQNISFGFRTLFKSKVFALTAVLTLALGIGATTAMFSVVYAVFEPMPYPNPDQLVIVWAKTPGRNSVPFGDFLEWQRRSTSFQGMGSWSGASFNVATDDRPEQVPGSRRTPGFFTMEGLPLFLGRDFLPEEGQVGQDHVVILSHRLWSNHFNSNRDLIGNPIRMNGEPYTVVGVLPPGTYDRFNSQLWVPLTFRPEKITHDSNAGLVMARLKDGVTIGKRLIVMFDESETREIVGVVADVLHAGLHAQPRAQMFVPHQQSPGSYMTFLVKTTNDPAAQLAAVKRAIREVNPNQTFAKTVTMEELVSDSLALVASFIPARRATKVDPLVALRSE